MKDHPVFFKPAAMPLTVKMITSRNEFASELSGAGVPTSDAASRLEYSSMDRCKDCASGLRSEGWDVAITLNYLGEAKMMAGNFDEAQINFRDAFRLALLADAIPVA